MTREELLQLADRSLTTDIVTAGRAFGMGRALSYDLAGRNEFPVQVLRLGHRLRVRTADLLAALGVTADGSRTEPTGIDLENSEAGAVTPASAATVRHLADQCSHHVTASG